MKLRIGDEVLVMGGKDKGRRGTIERVFQDENKVLLPGVNIYKKHQKGFPGRPGGIIEFSRPLPVASVALVCPNCGARTRVGYKLMNDGEKVRICRKCKRQINKKEKK